MTIQETIIGALKASQSAHSRALATIAGLRSERAALEAEVARLNAQVANLRSHIAHLEAEAVKIVEPVAVQTLLAALMQTVEESNQATTTPVSERDEPAPAEEIRPDEMPPLGASRLSLRHFATS